MGESGHLMLYNLLGRRIEFVQRVARTGQKILISGLVKDMIRDIHQNKMIVVFEGNRRVYLAFPSHIEWVGDSQCLVLEYGTAETDEAVADAPPDYEADDPLASHHSLKITILE